jgi:hypothetical protein
MQFVFIFFCINLSCNVLFVATGIGDFVLSIYILLSAGYDVCTTIGKASESRISLIGNNHGIICPPISLLYESYLVVCFRWGRTDESNPQKGVIVKMSSSKCSISVFIFCDSAVVQVSRFFQVNMLFFSFLCQCCILILPCCFLLCFFQLPDKFSLSGNCDYVGTQSFSKIVLFGLADFLIWH